MVCCFLFRNLKLGTRSTAIAAAAGILGLTSKGSSLLLSYSTLEAMKLEVCPAHVRIYTAQRRGGVLRWKYCGEQRALLSGLSHLSARCKTAKDTTAVNFEHSA